MLSVAGQCEALLGKCNLCLRYGGVSLRFEDSARHDTVRFSFLVDAASCTPSPQSLFSVPIRHHTHLLGAVQLCAYPAAHACARLSLQLGEQVFSTCFPCGAWIAAELRVTHSGAACSSSSRSSPRRTSPFTLSLTVGSASFAVSDDFPQSYFRGSLCFGSRGPETTAQPAVFRNVFALVSPHSCSRCSALPLAPEPGFLALLPLRCSPPDVEGDRRCPPVRRAPISHLGRASEGPSAACSSIVVMPPAQPSCRSVPRTALTRSQPTAARQ
jgi:hypothetical protein